MALFVWSDEYSVNIKVLDDQHKKIVEFINLLHAGMLSNNAKEALGKILKDLVVYTKTHFQEEEKLFLDYGYLQSSVHKAKHVSLIKQVEEIQAKYDAGALALSVEVSQFLTDWLKNHILVEDKKYMKFFSDKGVY